MPQSEDKNKAHSLLPLKNPPSSPPLPKFPPLLPPKPLSEDWWRKNLEYPKPRPSP